jgi:hypothetical protein
MAGTAIIPKLKPKIVTWSAVMPKRIKGLAVSANGGLRILFSKGSNIDYS